MYRVKATVEKPNSNVLLEFVLGHSEEHDGIYSDPRNLGATYVRNPDDHSYGEIYMDFESKDAYDSFVVDHPNYTSNLTRMKD